VAKTDAELLAALAATAPLPTGFTEVGQSTRESSG